jgi:hypothetical protein
MAPSRRKVLVVGCRFDEDRRGGARPWRTPQAMAPVFLAGAFNPKTCDIRVYSELYSGPLNDRHLLGWPDMLVLTGLQVDFDRYLHLTAYARTFNPRVVVVAGGSLVELSPTFSRRFFDYSCAGPVEDLREVIVDAFGPSFVADDMRPRYEKAYWSKLIGAVESSRYCNFRCSFCTMSIHTRPYERLHPDHVREEILRTRRMHIFFLDNNFFGSDPQGFERMIDMLAALKRDRLLKGWSAEVTADFFLHEENLIRARDSGCSALFCGVESFDRETLSAFNKRQNTTADPRHVIHRCLQHGIAFLYGLMLDPTRRSLNALQREIDELLASPDLPLPSYFTLPIPLLSTPFFFECLEQRRILPHTRVRDLDGVTLCLQPLDGIDAFRRWWPDFLRLRHRRLGCLWHEARLLSRYRRSLGSRQKVAVLGSVTGLCLPKYRRPDRTFVSTSEVLDPQYTPVFRVDGKFESYFRPTYVTDSEGQLVPELEELRVPSGPERRSQLDRPAKLLS